MTIGIDMMDGFKDWLCEQAFRASERALCHVSGYHVGAALVRKPIHRNDEVFYGFNVETDIHSATVHAEHLAMLNYFQEYTQPIQGMWLAVWTNEDDPYFPCGHCRQILFERLGPTLNVIACGPKTRKESTLVELLPGGFRKSKKK